MKTTTIFFVIASLFVCCKEIIEDNGPSIRLEFQIKNSSSKTVEVKLYKPDDKLFNSIFINSNDSAILDEGFIRPAPSGPSYSLTNSLDSAELLFSDGKKIIQTFNDRGNNDTVNNILSSLFYESQKLSETATVMKFTLSEQDYLRAK